MGLERGPLSLVSTTEELLERKSSGSGLGVRLGSKILSRTKATEFDFCCCLEETTYSAH
jgi:hypothetical protein